MCLCLKEKNKVLGDLATKATMTTEILNSIDGITCNEVMGAMYAFPKITLPQKAIDQAKVSTSSQTILLHTGFIYLHHLRHCPRLVSSSGVASTAFFHSALLVVVLSQPSNGPFLRSMRGQGKRVTSSVSTAETLSTH